MAEMAEEESRKMQANPTHDGTASTDAKPRVLRVRSPGSLESNDANDLPSIIEHPHARAVQAADQLGAHPDAPPQSDVVLPLAL